MHVCGKKFCFLQTASQVAGATVSITSMQNWPQGQICSQLLETALQKNAAYFLGCHTDSILLRKI